MATAAPNVVPTFRKWTPERPSATSKASMWANAPAARPRPSWRDTIPETTPAPIAEENEPTPNAAPEDLAEITTATAEMQIIDAPPTGISWTSDAPTLEDTSVNLSREPASSKLQTDLPENGAKSTHASDSEKQNGTNGVVHNGTEPSNGNTISAVPSGINPLFQNKPEHRILWNLTKGNMTKVEVQTLTRTYSFVEYMGLHHSSEDETLFVTPPAPVVTLRIPAVGEFDVRKLDKRDGVHIEDVFATAKEFLQQPLPFADRYALMVKDRDATSDYEYNPENYKYIRLIKPGMEYCVGFTDAGHNTFEAILKGSM